MTISVEPSRFTVRGLPVDDANSPIWQLTVEYRGPDSWAICHLSRCWDGEQFDYEPLGSARDDEYKRTHRWPLDEALRIAVEVYPKLVVNGYRVEDGRLVLA